MTSPLRVSSAWSSPAKAVLTLAFLVSQMPAQAAPKTPAPPKPGSAEPTLVATGKGRAPHHHRATKRGLAKPATPSTQPQQPVGALR